jgi:hypothetical protein
MVKLIDFIPLEVNYLSARLHLVVVHTWRLLFEALLWSTSPLGMVSKVFMIILLLERLAHFSRAHFLLCTWFGEIN